MVARRRALKAEMTKLASDITAIDRVMTMLDPTYAPEANRANGSGPRAAARCSAGAR
jgi:hypothetical protein